MHSTSSSRSLQVRGATDFARLLLERRYFDENTRLTVERPAPRPANLQPFFYEVLGYVEIEPDRVRELTTNLLAGLHAAMVPIRIWIRRTPDGTFKIWYGAERTTAHSGQLLRQQMEGNFLGMDLRDVKASEVARERAEFGAWSDPVAGFIVGIPSERADTAVETRLDEAFEALARHEFELVLRCEPIRSIELDTHIDRLGSVAELAHGQARRNLSEAHGENYSKSLAKGVSEATTTGKTWSDGTSETENKRGGAGWGALIGGAAGFIAGMCIPGAQPVAAPFLASAGSSLGSAVGSLLSPGGSTGTTHQEGGSSGETTSWQQTATQQWGESVQRQVSFDNICYSAEQLEEMARCQLTRLRVSRALGGWRVAIGLVAPSEEVLETGAHALIGALRGDDSWLESPRLVRVAPESVRAAIDTVRNFGEVLIHAAPHPLIPGGEHPSTVLSSIELSHWLRPPARELPGIRMRRPVHFARALPAVGQLDDVVLGPLEYWGRESRVGVVRLARRDFCQHTMIAGTTGGGKTTTVRSILWQLATGEMPVPFLVLEPAKDEYRSLFELLRSQGHNPLRLTVGGSTVKGSEGPLHFNPLAIPKGLVAGQHVEQIKILLRASFSMQEALPQILERVLLETYSAFGLHSKVLAQPFGGGAVPDLLDLVRLRRASKSRSRIAAVVKRFGYDERVEKNYVAALTVRLESFGVGLKESVFLSGDLDFEDILSRPTFINISGIPEPDVRRFLMAALVIRLYGERVARAQRGERVRPDLKHLLVLEEAHHFIRRAEGNGPSVELHRETNTLLANAFAELRAFGQGILVADQAPGDLDAAVLRNTNTKLCHGLFHEADCQAMADSMGLDHGQRTELRRLEVGQAVVFGPSYRQAVACRVDDKVPKAPKTETG